VFTHSVFIVSSNKEWEVTGHDILSLEFVAVYISSLRELYPNMYT
jgi:hypothetical protein